jgi:hypothetical protein
MEQRSEDVLKEAILTIWAGKRRKLGGKGEMVHKNNIIISEGKALCS